MVPGNWPGRQWATARGNANSAKIWYRPNLVALSPFPFGEIVTVLLFDGIQRFGVGLQSRLL
jgi:hypothetical protein